MEFLFGDHKWRYPHRWQITNPVSNHSLALCYKQKGNMGLRPDMILIPPPPFKKGKAVLCLMAGTVSPYAVWTCCYWKSYPRRQTQRGITEGPLSYTEGVHTWWASLRRYNNHSAIRVCSGILFGIVRQALAEIQTTKTQGTTLAARWN